MLQRLVRAGLLLAASLGAGPAVAQSLTISGASGPEGNTGLTDFTLTVTLSPASSQTVTVNWATANNSATTADSDYLAASATLTFPPGSTSRTLTVQGVGDTRLEGDETFFVLLSGPVNATLGNSSALVTLLNDDVTVNITGSSSQAEGNSGLTPFTFTVSLSAPYELTVTVDWNTADNTATAADGDYVPASGTLTFAPGETSKSLTVHGVGDTRLEGNESFFVRLSSAVNATLNVQTASATLLNDDVTVNISGSSSQPEGNSGLTPFTFTVSLSAPYTLTVTVDWSTADNTATSADNDYVPASGTLSFAPGETSKSLTVHGVGDLQLEGTESFFVVLSNAVNATINLAAATATLVNDDIIPGIAVGDLALAEGTGGPTPFELPVSLSAATSLTVSVAYATSDGTAAAGSDYTTTTGTLTFAPGETLKMITVSVAGDAAFEDDETFQVTLSEPVNGTLTDPIGIATILNDDELEASIDDVVQGEGDAGLSSFVFTVSLSGVAADALEIGYAVTGGSASPGIDVDRATGTLVIPAGQTSLSLAVQVMGDLDHEIDETFHVWLAVPSGVVLADGEGLGTILDDDSACSPTAPHVTDLRVELAPGGTSLQLTWSDVPGADSYDLHASAIPGEPFGSLAATAASGTPGIALPVPAVDTFYLLAAVNTACGPGPRRVCAHPLCATGSRLDSACDPCAAATCALDASCCTDGWDGACVALAGTACGLTCD